MDQVVAVVLARHQLVPDSPMFGIVHPNVLQALQHGDCGPARWDAGTATPGAGPSPGALRAGGSMSRPTCFRARSAFK